MTYGQADQAQNVKAILEERGHVKDVVEPWLEK